MSEFDKPAGNRWKAANLLASVRNHYVSLRSRLRSADAKFTDIYRARGFGDSQSVSGPGSDLEQTRIVRQELPKLIREFQVRSLLDIPCGDFHWMRQVDLELERYLGADIVQPLVDENNRSYGNSVRSFVRLDLMKDALPAVDMILCRDCLVHLSLRDCERAVRRIRASRSRLLLTTTFPATAENADLITARGWRARNLQLPPFTFPAPLRLINEQCTEMGGKYADKSLGLWRVADLPEVK